MQRQRSGLQLATGAVWLAAGDWGGAVMDEVILQLVGNVRLAVLQELSVMDEVTATTGGCCVCKLN